MKDPYYQDKWATIYLGDCLEIMPELEPVDLVLTDPPYGLGDRWNGGAGGEKSNWRIPPEEAKKWDTRTLQRWVNLSRSKGIHSIIWGGNYYTLPITRCWLIWDKKQPDTWTTGQAEMAWTSLDRPIRVFRMAQCEAHATKEMGGRKQHSAQKPLSLMKWCLKWCICNTILDPFMGSGTTLVAAKQLNRKAIGIDIEEKYCEIAINRLAQEVMEF